MPNTSRRARAPKIFAEDFWAPLTCVSLLILTASPVAADVRFQPVALPSEHTYTGGWEHFVGGGLAVLDCDGDSRPDLVAAGGTAPMHLFRNRSVPGRFQFATGALPDLTGVTGAWPLDIDSDGWLDLVVLRVGPNLILRGGPDCAFEDVTADWGFGAGTAWSTAFSATWEAGQNWPTLAVGNYVDRDDPAGPFGVCAPTELHRPRASGYGAALALTPGYCALSLLISDWARTGHRDLRVSNDRQYYLHDGSEQMWRLDPLPRLLGPADGFVPLSIWGMGIASRDLTGDGRPEVVLTSMGDQLLQYALPDPGYRAAPFAQGSYAHRPFVGDDGRPSTGWHAQFGDVDNDGRADLFIAKGNVDQMPGNAMKDPNNLLMQQPDGTFAEAADRAGVASVARGRGAALVDLDGDGRLDLAVVNRRAPMEVWRNVTLDTGHWIAVEPRQAGPNGRAVGGWVEMRPPGQPLQTQEITVGGGHGGGTAGVLHFGMGVAGQAEVRVIWPDGAASDWVTLPADWQGSVWRQDTGLELRPRP